jgi:hypothetical protein
MDAPRDGEAGGAHLLIPALGSVHGGSELVHPHGDDVTMLGA